MNRRPAVVVLSAGEGARFTGSGHKLEQKLGPDGETLLARTLRHAIETGMRVVVVCSEALAPLALNQVAARDCVVLPKELPRSGMGYSIAAGVGAAGDANGWLIVPGDMPLMQPSSILAVAEAIKTYPVAYAQHRGRRGHPVGFSAELYSELLGLHGDEGARRIVARYPAQGVDVDDIGVLLDVDTREDLQQLASKRHSMV
ncbi:MAG: nucleotidyltransferase family protein [Paucibacter sp.]|nr:nucleotidyltransferase family protein [Roseateles sp.]